MKVRGNVLQLSETVTAIDTVASAVELIKIKAYTVTWEFGLITKKYVTPVLTML